MTNNKQQTVQQIKDFLYAEVCERREYSASRMCEEVIKFIEQMEKQILETLKITPEQLKAYNDKKQKIRDQTAARNKIYKIRNAEKLEQIRAEKAQKRQELKQQQLTEKPEIKNEVVKITRKYTKKAPINKDDN